MDENSQDNSSGQANQAPDMLQAPSIVDTGSGRPSADGNRPSVDGAPEPEEAPTYILSYSEVARRVETDLNKGLTTAEAKHRLKVEGKNIIGAKSTNPWWKILFHHIFNFMTFVLIFAMIVSLTVQEWIDAAVILFVIILNVGIGFFQEFKSEQTMAKLKKMTAANARVIRDGETIEIASSDVVRGDIILLKQGDKVSADVRLVKCVNFETVEALLTGESEPIAKFVEALPSSLQETEVVVAERKNMAFHSTNVAKGKATAIVVATGMKTEMGKIAKDLSSTKKEETQLQRRMKILGIILIFGAIFSFILVLLGVGFHEGWHKLYPEGMQLGVSTAVAIIPESLVAVTTLTLSLGVRSMAEQRAIVRKLAALESLGNITNIASDKTGTLTEGKMVVRKAWIAGEVYDVTSPIDAVTPVGELRKSGTTIGIEPSEFSPSIKLAISIASVCNSASIVKTTEEEIKNDNSLSAYKTTGDPTEVSLQILAHKLNMAKTDMVKQGGQYPTLVHEYPFDSTIKRMSVIYENKDQELYLFTKGAPEALLNLCTSRVTGSDGSEEVLTNEVRDYIKQVNEGIAAEGLRVLCLAYRKPNRQENFNDREEIERDLTFVGLVGIQDPPRKGVKKAVQTCINAGITVHMVTGDQITTATAIAKQVRIIQTKKQEKLVMKATEFDALSEKDLAQMKELPIVIARCSPQTKVKLVKALHAKRKIVAMSGDGVNDSIAIKSADVGVAMGKTGSDVTKEASDIVITDDNFATIVIAIREGRRIFANIRKFIIHLLTGNVAEVIALVVPILAGMGTPLNPTQILWVNMITGTPPAVGLGIEPIFKGIMDKNKRQVDEAMFTPEAIVDIFFYGTLMGACTLATYFIDIFWFLVPREDAQAPSFGTLTILLLFHAYNCRHLRKAFYRDNLYKSTFLHKAVLFGICSTCFTLYVPFVNDKIMHQRGLDWREWLVVISALIVFMTSAEVYKFIKRRVRKLYMSGYKKKQSALLKKEEEEFAAYEKTLADQKAAVFEMKDVNSSPSGNLVNIKVDEQHVALSTMEDKGEEYDENNQV